MNGFHLAGIVPVAGQPLDFGMPWHDALMPLAPNYLAVERAVVECAYAGCETIWVVCNDDMQPLIRHRLGDYVQDPVWVYRHYEYKKANYQKPIPIYYVPIHPRDRNKRDCLSWSVLYGAWRSTKISSALSRWFGPDMFYVAFPYGVYHVSVPRDHRKAISSGQKVVLTHQGRSVKDGEYLGFTFNPEDLEKLNSEVKLKSTGLYANQERTEKLPLDERFSYRRFRLEEVFDTLDIQEAHEVEVSKYWRIDSWEGYKQYLAKGAEKFKRPAKSILNYKEWNGIGIDEE